MARSDDRKIRCAFCGRTQDQVDKLIAGNGAYICSDCVRLCMNIVDEDLPQRTDPGKSAPSAASSISTSWTRYPAKARTFRLRVMSPARVCSRRC